VRLDDVADAYEGVENNQLAAGRPGPRVILNVQPSPARRDRHGGSVKALLPQLRATISQAVDVSILADRTETVRASVEDVQFTLVLTVLLVIAVIYVFLRSLRRPSSPAWRCRFR